MLATLDALMVSAFGDLPSAMTILAIVMALLALPTLLALTTGGMRANYGRYSSDKLSMPGESILVPGRTAWIIQEIPCVIFVGLRLASRGLTDALSDSDNTPNVILLSLFLIHYTHRAIVFPFMLKCRPIPLPTMFMAFFFCVYNGYMQSTNLIEASCASAYGSSWLVDPRFICGCNVFFLGMLINIHSDYTLIALRRSRVDKEYKIPRGGMFDYVSGANFFGEIVEWTGFAIACWSIPAAAFALFTFCNIAPRAASHHKFYLEKFREEYPKSRRAVIPFIW